MAESFDKEAARKNLEKRDLKDKEERENLRKKILAKTVSVLEGEFQGTNVEVYLVGSVARPNSFNKNSDVDVVLKNFSGDRFDIWTKLEAKIGRDVEVIIFEACEFKDHVIEQGLKVL